MQTLLSANQSARTILVILQNSMGNESGVRENLGSLIVKPCDWNSFILQIFYQYAGMVYDGKQ